MKKLNLKNYIWICLIFIFYSIEAKKHIGKSISIHQAEHETSKSCILQQKCAELPTLDAFWHLYNNGQDQINDQLRLISTDEALKCVQRRPLRFVGDSRVSQIGTLISAILR